MENRGVCHWIMPRRAEWTARLAIGILGNFRYMELVLASGNADKQTELTRIFESHSLILGSEICNVPAPREDSPTYLENALIKARAFLGYTNGRPIIADDSGISVPALGGAPGVFSARYGSEKLGRKLNDSERNELLLEDMAGLRGPERRAFFVCSMVLLVGDYRFFTAQEVFEGLVADRPSGTGGFGYDPIFFVPSAGCTVSELAAEAKDRISHRGRAGRRIKAVLDSLHAEP